VENISCPLARFHLRIEKPDLKSLSETLVGWTDAVDQDTRLKFLKSANRVNKPYKYISYFGYPKKGLKNLSKNLACTWRVPSLIDERD